MKMLINKIEEYFVLVFLAALFFLRIPSFYIIPSIKNDLITSQAVARLFMIMVFFYQAIRLFFSQDQQSPFSKKSHIPLMMVTTFFFIQSLSILPAINVVSFLQRYKDVFIGFISFLNFYFYRKHIKKIITVILIASLINLIYQGFMIFNQKIFIELFSNLIYEKHWNLVRLKLLNEGKINIDVYDEILVPFLIIGNSLMGKKLRYFLILAITFFSFISNVRVRILMLSFNLISSFILFWKTGFIKKNLILISGLALVIFMAGWLSTSYFRFSFLDRIMLESESEDYQTVVHRIVQVKTTIDMGKSSLLGVGLGNYYDNLSLKNFNKNRYDYKNYWHIGGVEYVHNIFGTVLAESGYFSFAIFVLTLSVFAYYDFKILRTNDKIKKAFIIGFWSLFIYSLFDPPVPVTFQVFFWGIRGLLL